METEKPVHQYHFLAYTALFFGIVAIITSLWEVLTNVQPTSIYLDQDALGGAFVSAITHMTFYVASGTSFTLSLLLLVRKNTRTRAASVAFVLSILALSWYGVAVGKYYINEQCNIFGSSNVFCHPVFKSNKITDEYY